MSENQDESQRYAEWFRRNLRTVRESRGMSAAKLSEAMQSLGFSSIRRQAITAIENGSRVTKVEEAFALAEVLEVPIDVLMQSPHAREVLVDLSRLSSTAGEVRAAAYRFYLNQLTVAIRADKAAGLGQLSEAQRAKIGAELEKTPFDWVSEARRDSDLVFEVDLTAEEGSFENAWLSAQGILRGPESDRSEQAASQRITIDDLKKAPQLLSLEHDLLALDEDVDHLRMMATKFYLRQHAVAVRADELARAGKLSAPQKEEVLKFLSLRPTRFVGDAWELNSVLSGIDSSAEEQSFEHAWLKAQGKLEGPDNGLDN